jgi:Rrf2 family protein
LKYTKATNYALHTIAFMIKNDKNHNLNLETLAGHLKNSSTYLSKILTQLVKADLIQSTSGVNGGYILRKKMEDISFMDVIRATEGTGALFNCEVQEKADCCIQKVMTEAENAMENYLQNKKLFEVVQSAATTGIGEKHQCNSKEAQHLESKKAYLDMPERTNILPPEKLLQMLPIKNSDNILDLGVGTGYIAIPAAKMVDGLVYALDNDSRMLEVIDNKAQSQNITNIQLVKGNIYNIPLPDDSIDIVIASLVLHEVKPLSKSLQQIKRVLKEGGYFLCFEFENKESPIPAPPMNIRIPSSTMEQELISSGFRIIQKLFPRDYVYIFIVKK